MLILQKLKEQLEALGYQIKCFPLAHQRDHVILMIKQGDRHLYSCADTFFRAQQIISDHIAGLSLNEIQQPILTPSLCPEVQSESFRYDVAVSRSLGKDFPSLNVVC